MILVAAESLWYLWSLFYQDTQHSQWGWFTNLLWYDILQNKAPCIGPRHICYTYTLCPFSGRKMNAEGSRVGWIISLARVGYGVSSRTTFVAATLGLPTYLGVGRSWFFQLLQSDSSLEVAW